MGGTSLKFGTSGLRGLACELNGLPAYAYAYAFVQMLADSLQPGANIYVGRDLRPSSPDIAALAMAAIADAGFTPIDCGEVPTPALSLHAMANHAPCIMVTGSHIPDDRNGLKFYRADGEIDKKDEQAISALHASLPEDLAIHMLNPSAIDKAAGENYVARYVDFLGPNALQGLRIGIYQHSSVARDLLTATLSALGAEVVALGRSDIFVPVDTEALRAEDIGLLARWAGDEHFDAIVSTDGDADRPLIADEKGQFVRGDLVGAITAAWVGADTIVTPVTSNSALESCGRFERILRTRVGSPYVIEGMERAGRENAAIIVGFEANGGVLLGSDIERSCRKLTALPTRDAFLPILATVSTIADQREPLSRIAQGFGFRIALSDRLQNIPRATSSAFLAALDHSEKRDALFQNAGTIVRTETIDGVKLFFDNGNAVHYRASGNAPELRCYVEAKTENDAKALLALGLDVARNATKDA
ncbi:phosphomannomutase [Daeguia caeni]|uniref:Phosphomannomutase n=1 Tax=Daeguia caeni TaxID=439612 RepID=A0ABV9H4H7_9HYPH